MKRDGWILVAIVMDEPSTRTQRSAIGLFQTRATDEREEVSRSGRRIEEEDTMDDNSRFISGNRFAELEDVIELLKISERSFLQERAQDESEIVWRIAARNSSDLRDEIAATRVRSFGAQEFSGERREMLLVWKLGDAVLESHRETQITVTTIKTGSRTRRIHRRRTNSVWLSVRTRRSRRWICCGEVSWRDRNGRRRRTSGR